ncbi:MAG: hypothetical protein R6U98_20265 [Pirellulaceae bacterium]
MLKRLLSFVLGLGLVTALTGCAMCFTPYDDDYNAYGGIVERQDRGRGRVGSILSDPSLQYTEATGMADEATEEDLYPMEEDRYPMEEDRYPMEEDRYPMEMEQPRIEPPSDEPLPPPKPELESRAETGPETDGGPEAETDEAPNGDH